MAGFGGGLRSGSRVAPCSDDGDDSFDPVVKIVKMMLMRGGKTARSCPVS